MIQKSVTYAYGLSVAPLWARRQDSSVLCGWSVALDSRRYSCTVCDVLDADDGLYPVGCRKLYGQCRVYIDAMYGQRIELEGVTRCKLRAATIFTQKSK